MVYFYVLIEPGPLGGQKLLEPYIKMDSSALNIQDAANDDSENNEDANENDDDDDEDDK